jgi:tyrosyl-tRNA synthetase
MTIGNLAAVMMVRLFMAHGHKGILLAGGATGLIGDPDGKKQERDLKTPEEIAKNVAGLEAQYRQLLPGMDFSIVNNMDWFKDIGYMQFLREIGKYTSMTQLLNRDFIQSRIGEGGSGISYAEFSYVLIQGYDFLHLYREHGATLQLCGADQWGNSVTGVDLIRKLEATEAHVFSTPLVINKQTGVKFGKSEGGAVWLDPSKTSPFKFYQFWLNCDDEMSEDLIKIYTLLDKETIESLIATHRENPGERALQKTLAREVTDFVHGRERRESVERVTGVLFGGEAVASLNDADLDALATEITTVPRGNSVIDTLTTSGVAASNGEAKRLIAGNAISINGQKISDDVQITDVSLVKKGKNVFVLVR